jgi:hypothetical protein
MLSLYVQLGFSTLFHAGSCHSHTTYFQLCACDYGGVIMSIVMGQYFGESALTCAPHGGANLSRSDLLLDVLLDVVDRRAHSQYVDSRISGARGDGVSLSSPRG